jgi:hypothetical protein
VFAVLVAVNEEMLRPGRFTMLCLTLVSFEPVGADIVYMSELAHAIFAMQGAPQSDRDLRYVAGLSTDRKSAKYRRRKLPVSFTGGPTVYCAELVIDRDRLPQGYITENVLSCIAVPGNKGALELLPWQLAYNGSRDPDADTAL